MVFPFTDHVWVLAHASSLLGGRYRPDQLELLRTGPATVHEHSATIATAASVVVVCLALTDLAEEAFVAAGASLLAVGVYGWCIWRLYERFKATENPVESTRLSYLVFGGVVSIVLSVIDLLPALELPSPALGHVWTTVYMYFWMQVVLRSRLLDLKELLGRGLELLILSSFISLIYATLLVWVDNSLGLFFFNTIAASVLLFFVFEPLKRVVDVWVGRLLFRSTHELESCDRGT